MQQVRRRAVLLAGAGTLLAACTHGVVGGMPYSVGVRGAGNVVTITYDSGEQGQNVLVTVQSGGGIGEATIAWWGSTLPHQLLFYLDLTGLEHFRLMWSTHIVTVASSGNSVLQWLQSGSSSETTLDPASPYWMPINVPDKQEQGYRLQAPPAFIADAPRIWGFAWLDFYL